MFLSLRSGLVSLSFALVAFTSFAGCSKATVGVNSATLLEPNSAGICAGHCQTLGLSLSAVVVMANNVGCVCAAQGAPPSAAPSSAQSSSSAGGMAAILMQEEADRAAQNSQAARKK